MMDIKFTRGRTVKKMSEIGFYALNTRMAGDRVLKQNLLVVHIIQIVYIDVSEIGVKLSEACFE